MTDQNPPEEPVEVITARVPTAVVERVRNAVWALGRGRTFQVTVAEGLEMIAAHLEQEHNGGKPFPQRTTELPRSKKGKGKKKPGDKA